MLIVTQSGRLIQEILRKEIKELLNHRDDFKGIRLTGSYGTFMGVRFMIVASFSSSCCRSFALMALMALTSLDSLGAIAFGSTSLGQGSRESNLIEIMG